MCHHCTNVAPMLCAWTDRQKTRPNSNTLITPLQETKRKIKFCNRLDFIDAYANRPGIFIPMSWYGWQYRLFVCVSISKAYGLWMRLVADNSNGIVIARMLPSRQLMMWCVGAQCICC